jgi:hypothetical protein
VLPRNEAGDRDRPLTIFHEREERGDRQAAAAQERQHPRLAAHVGPLQGALRRLDDTATLADSGGHREVREAAERRRDVDDRMPGEAPLQQRHRVWWKH